MAGSGSKTGQPLLKVLHIVSDTNIGGAGRLLLNFLACYDRQRLQVSVLCPAGSLLAERCASYHGVTVLALPELPADESFAPGRLWKQIPAIIRVIRQYRIDVVHTHASFAGRLAARLAGGVCVIYTRHRLEAEAAGDGLRSRLLSWVNNYTCDRVVAISQAVRDDLLSQGVPDRKIALIYNGIDLANFQPLLSPPAGPGAVVGLVGRLEAEKGHRCFLEAARILLAKHGECRFWIVGAGSLLKELQDYAWKLGIAGQVDFLGLRDDIPELLAQMSVVTVPSLNEAFALSLVEAMSMGKPCVASNIGGIREILVDRENGLLVEPGNPRALASRIAWLLERPDEARQMGEAAARTAASRFDARVMTERLTALYTECVRERASQTQNIGPPEGK
ncbi:MAG: glycosyltransferase family 4 protein [Thermacetogeniaceae bacterium]